MISGSGGIDMESAGADLISVEVKGLCRIGATGYYVNMEETPISIICVTIKRIEIEVSANHLNFVRYVIAQGEFERKVLQSEFHERLEQANGVYLKFLQRFLKK